MDALILKMNQLIEPQYQAIYSFKKKLLPTNVLISIESDDTTVAPVNFFEGDPFFVLDFASSFTTLDPPLQKVRIYNQCYSHQFSLEF